MKQYLVRIDYPDNLQVFQLWHRDEDSIYYLEVTQYEVPDDEDAIEIFNLDLGSKYEAALDEMFRQIKAVLLQ